MWGVKWKTVLRGNFVFCIAELVKRKEREDGMFLYYVMKTSEGKRDGV
jgi:hypothetical protein